MDWLKSDTVTILLPGPSVVEFKEAEGILATVNDYWIFEKDFGIMFAVVLAAADECDMSRYTSFLDRGVLLTTERAIGNLKHKNIVLFTTDEPPLVRPVPTIEEPFTFRPLPSFALLILMCAIAGAKTFYLYGADGGQIEGKPLYYKDWPSESLGRLAMDTKVMNENWDTILTRTCKVHGIEKPTIYNMSKESHYSCFTKN